jgi:hypothetical protein
MLIGADVQYSCIEVMRTLSAVVHMSNYVCPFCGIFCK